MNGQVAVLFDNFGPYHWARVEAAARRMPLAAIEVCEKTREYAWENTPSPAIERRTLLKAAEGDGQSAPARLIKARLSAVLNEISPLAVAIPGWATKASLSALSWCLKNRTPAIVMSESSALDKSRSLIKEALKRRVISCFSSALVGGRPQADYIQSLGMPADRIFLGYDVVDNDYFARESANARAQAREIRGQLALPERYLLASSRFIEKKNLPRLLEAFARYRTQSGPDKLSLVLLGDGPLRETLLEKSRELALEIDKAVFFPGFKQYHELPPYYGLAEGFIHASTSEQWGLVVNEAMASGLPVLVSNRCGCASDLVADAENGWTFDPFDTEKITDAMMKLGNAGNRTLMGETSKRIVAGFGVDSFGVGLLNSVQFALADPRNSGNLLDHLLLKSLTGWIR